MKKIGRSVQEGKCCLVDWKSRKCEVLRRKTENSLKFFLSFVAQRCQLFCQMKIGKSVIDRERERQREKVEGKSLFG